MAEHIWTVVCDNAVVDKRTGKVSLLNVVDRITVADPNEELRTLGKKDNTVVPITLWLVSWWQRSNPSEGEVVDIRVLIRSPKGERILNPEIASIDLKESHRGRLFTLIPALPLRGAGQYRVCVEYETPKGKWRQVASSPLDVRFADSQDEMQAIALGTL